MDYQWYPGHMTKARRMMQENIKLIDLVIELVDARIPLSSRNPDLNDLAYGKSRLILLNKADLADERKTKEWVKYFEKQGFFVVSLDSRQRNGMKAIEGCVAKACSKKIERDRSRGILNRPVRTMVVGIPNVGKSTFINSFAKKAVAKTGNRPGVTKGKQWIRMSDKLELLDTPGILWPKMGDQQTGLHLALIGSMNDEILDPEKMALSLIGILQKDYPQTLEKRYEGLYEAAEKINSGAAFADGTPAKIPHMSEDGEDPVAILEGIAMVRGCMKKGGQADTARAAGLLLEDFRSGRLGRITLEEAPADEETEGSATEEETGAQADA
ncbi:MAG: ribosome biogenesis GTPase YlqF [Lachnospiraceae bacterium]|nr:ribosome biogenesis GTPase YlqF [Lachnospiraceae bacterium]